MAKNLRKPKTGVKNPAVAALLLSFGCGVGVCILLLALAAFLLTHTGLPLSAVRPMACMAAAVGAAVSASVLARRLQKRLLLCGLGCGAFYAVCLLAAILLLLCCRRVRVGATLTATGLAALLLLLPALLLNLPGLLHPLSSIAQAQVTRALLLLGGAQAVFAAVTLLPGILLLRRAHA